MTTTLIHIREANGHEHDHEHRTGDLGIIYTPKELTRLIQGLPIWRGAERHDFTEARAARIAAERDVPRETPRDVLARYRPDLPVIAVCGVFVVGIVWLMLIGALAN